jgi:hypothetical protein
MTGKHFSHNQKKNPSGYIELSPKAAFLAKSNHLPPDYIFSPEILKATYSNRAYILSWHSRRNAVISAGSPLS